VEHRMNEDTRRTFSRQKQLVAYGQYYVGYQIVGKSIKISRYPSQQKRDKYA